MEDRYLQRRPGRAAVIAPVLVAHIAALYFVVAWMPVMQAGPPPPKAQPLKIIPVHPRPLPMPRELFSSISAPVAPFVPPPEIRVKPPPPTIHTSAVRRITQITGFTKIPGAGTRYVAGRLHDIKTLPVFVGSKPNYPVAYKNTQRPGYVSVVCMIHDDGKPGYCELVDVDGGQAFGEAVISWLHSGQVLYKPATLNGKPAQDVAMLKVHFNQYQ